VAVSASSLFHGDADDTLCNPPSVVHDHTAHRLVGTDGSSPSPPEHCYLCHWHSLRTVQAVVQFHAPTLESGAVARLETIVAAATESNRQPARAPPLV
jgi:hypothetical protein